MRIDHFTCDLNGFLRCSYLHVKTMNGYRCAFFALISKIADPVFNIPYCNILII